MGDLKEGRKEAILGHKGDGEMGKRRDNLDQVGSPTVVRVVPEIRIYAVCGKWENDTVTYYNLFGQILAAPFSSLVLQQLRPPSPRILILRVYEVRSSFRLVS